MSFRFEWDLAKAWRNLQKHGITFDEAATVFEDRLAVVFDDPEHSSNEVREIVVGHSVLERLLVVSFVQTAPNAIRLISSRKATRSETREYEER